MTPLKVVVVFLAIGLTFIPAGVSLLASSRAIYVDEVQYDGPNQNVDCAITSQNQNRPCELRFNFTEDVNGPVYVYYQLTNYFQNHRRYVASIDPYQLQGLKISKTTLKDSCTTLYENSNGLIINPCGLIANSFFTDIIALVDSNYIPTVTMDESDIAWEADNEKFSQPDGFDYVQITPDSGYTNISTCEAVGLSEPCEYYTDGTNEYFYYYPDAKDNQYLYQTYPNQISPIDGVKNQHFQVWMRAAALPKFRKLYGKIDGVDFKKGDYLTFQVNANYEVSSFDGTKSLVISTIGEFGGENQYLGLSYIIVGSISLLFGMLFVTKQILAPRDVADPSLLNWAI